MGQLPIYMSITILISFSFLEFVADAKQETSRNFLNRANLNTYDLLLEEKRSLTKTILVVKRAHNLTWEGIAKAVGRSPVWVTACCLGEASMDEPAAQRLVDYLKLSEEEKRIIMEPPIKGQIPKEALLQDPCIYRLQEVTLTYGQTIKELIQEKFGDGIMSAIDFKMEVEKEEDPAGDRVRIVMSGKFLPYTRW